MKTLRILMIALLFTAFSVESYALIDDCPCRRRVVKKIVKPRPVYRAPVKRVTLFDDTPYIPEDLGCRRPGMQQVVNYDLKVMPNPVQQILNVISFLEYSGIDDEAQAFLYSVYLLLAGVEQILH